MNITVFGANGKVGSLLIHRLLSQGHYIKAFVHGRIPFTVDPRLQIIQGDIYNADEVAEATGGSEAVISTLGSWGSARKDILFTGMKHIVPAMESKGINRIISLTGADAWLRNETPDFIHRISHKALQIGAPKILMDSEKHLELLALSKLDWTVLRSPIMNENGDKSFKLSTTRPQPWATIHRNAVVEALMTLFAENSFVKQSPFITRS
ncbi:MAG: SDR family oxidoreductase [bacterium]|nr:SDR family oxidoreductase [bacterium]